MGLLGDFKEIVDTLSKYGIDIDVLKKTYQNTLNKLNRHDTEIQELQATIRDLNARIQVLERKINK